MTDAATPPPGLARPATDAAERPAVRALVALPAKLERGVPAQVRATLAHPMETGHRRDSEGRPVPRDIVNRFEAWLDDRLVVSCDWFPAIAANPTLAFWLQTDAPATLRLEWSGDHGLRHREVRPLNPQ
jgi:sulfur-oxidizing protein SoxZ